MWMNRKAETEERNSYSIYSDISSGRPEREKHRRGRAHARAHAHGASRAPLRSSSLTLVVRKRKYPSAYLSGKFVRECERELKHRASPTASRRFGENETAERSSRMESLPRITQTRFCHPPPPPAGLIVLLPPDAGALNEL